MTKTFGTTTTIKEVDMTKKAIKALSNNDLIVEYILARDMATAKENYSRRGAKIYWETERLLLDEMYNRGIINDKNKSDLIL